MTSFWVFGLLCVGAALGGAILYYACAVPSSQLLGPAAVRGPSKARSVALTFDDGPAAPFTGEILDILRDYRVPAAFFVCGKNVERFPELVRRIDAEKHVIGNHTFTHSFLYFRSRKRIREEIDRTQKAVERVTGQRPALFRPPYGGRWFGLFDVLRERGMRMVQWSAAGFDWDRRRGAEEVVRATLKNLDAGSIILLHDGREPRPPGRVDAANTVAALPTLIEQVRKAGYSFVPLEEFLPPAADRKNL